MVYCKYCGKSFTNRFSRSRHIHNSCKKKPVIKCNFKINHDSMVEVCPRNKNQIEYYLQKLYLDKNNIKLRNKREKTIDIYIKNSWWKLNKKQTIKIMDKIGQHIEQILLNEIMYNNRVIDIKTEKLLDNKRLYRNKLIKLMTNKY